MLILFQSTHAVVNAQRCLQKNSVAVKVIPVPRSVSSDCGMALEIDAANQEAAEKHLNELNLVYQFYAELEA